MSEDTRFNPSRTRCRIAEEPGLPPASRLGVLLLSVYALTTLRVLRSFICELKLASPKRSADTEYAFAKFSVAPVFESRIQIYEGECALMPPSSLML
jgi:hypothetical protein